MSNRDPCPAVSTSYLHAVTVSVPQVQTLCEVVVEHLAEVTFQEQRVARMVLHLKVSTVPVQKGA